jgi:hypothetical protein
MILRVIRLLVRHAIYIEGYGNRIQMCPMIAVGFVKAQGLKAKPAKSG